MRRGMGPSEASRDALLRILKRVRKFEGALIAADKLGNHGAACTGRVTFTYSYQTNNTGTQLARVDCLPNGSSMLTFQASILFVHFIYLSFLIL
jgi:hypothetical protein